MNGMALATQLMVCIQRSAHGRQHALACRRSCLKLVRGGFRGRLCKSRLVCLCIERRVLCHCELRVLTCTGHDRKVWCRSGGNAADEHHKHDILLLHMCCPKSC